MNIANVTWEDEEKNRHVELSIAYAVENNEVTVREITPKSVSFLCEQGLQPVRSIQVHTATGRQLLSRQFTTSAAFRKIKDQIGGCSLTA